ncbi:MAG: hypothetical protein ACTSQP_00150 [Promethearchaeota archaeon]
MMKENIQSIYIIDSTGKPLFILEIYKSGNKNVEHALITNFVSAIQSFATELGDQHANTIKLGDSMLYSIKDEISGIYFVIKTDLDAKQKRIFGILKDIKNLYINIILSKINASEAEKLEALKEFEDELSKIFKKPVNIESFLEGL